MKKDILLVEDNPDDAELVTDVFHTLGDENRLKVVHSGEDALVLLFDTQHGKSNQWKVVLLDLNLPGISGVQVLKEIRQNPQTKNTPVVIVTSSKRDEDVLACYSEKVNGYVCKSVDSTEFTKSIETVKEYWVDVNQSLYGA